MWIEEVKRGRFAPSIIVIGDQGEEICSRVDRGRGRRRRRRRRGESGHKSAFRQDENEA